MLLLISMSASLLAGDPIGKKGRTLVVLVGISDYKYVDDLRFAHRDALAFQQYLGSTAGGEVPEMNIVKLINEGATAGQFAAGLDWLYDEVTEDDKVIIYFSGHGDTEQKFLTPDAYLLTYESPRFGYHGSAQEVSIIDKYIEYLVLSKKADVTLVADACRSGNLAGEEGTRKSQTTLALQQQRGNEVRILSCYPEQFSVEGTEWGDGRGAFSYFLVNGLTGLADRNNDGRVKLLELETFLKDVVPKAVAPKDQVPMIVSDNPSQTIALVDSMALAALRERISRENAGNPEDRRDKGVLSLPLDSGEQEIFDRFLILLESGNLVEGSSTDDKAQTAYEYYQEQIKKRQSRSLLNMMKRQLVGALLDPPNDLLSEYKMGLSTMMVGSREVPVSKVRDAIDYLEKAGEVMDPQSFSYNKVRSNQFFFEGLNLRMEADAKEVSGLYQQAVEKFGKSIQFQADNAAALNELGISQNRLGNNLAAAKSFQAAIQRAPKWLPPHMNLAITYELLKRSPDALLKYQDVIKLAESPLYESSALDNVSIQAVRNMLSHAQARIQELEKSADPSPSPEESPEKEPEEKSPKGGTGGQGGELQNDPSTDSSEKEAQKSSISSGKKKRMTYKEWKQFRARASAFSLAGPAAGFASLVAPGSGDYMVRNKVRPYYLLTLADWGLIAGGIYCKRKSNQIYNNDYLTANNKIEAQPFYDKANRYHHAYLVMIGSAVAITATDVVLVTMRGRKNSRKRKGKSVGERLQITPGFEFSPYAMNQPSYAMQIRWNF